MASATPRVGKEGDRREREGGGEVVIITSTPWNAGVRRSLAADRLSASGPARTGCERMEAIELLVITGE